MKQISMVKGEERFLFRYERCRALVDVFETLARDPSSGFDWYDASVLCFKLAHEAAAEKAAAEARQKAEQECSDWMRKNFGPANI